MATYTKSSRVLLIHCQLLVLTECLPSLLPVRTDIVNGSLDEAFIPNSLKIALVISLLKSNLNTEDFRISVQFLIFPFLLNWLRNGLWQLCICCIDLLAALQEEVLWASISMKMTVRFIFRLTLFHLLLLWKSKGAYKMMQLGCIEQRWTWWWQDRASGHWIA